MAVVCGQWAQWLVIPTLGWTRHQTLAAPGFWESFHGLLTHFHEPFWPLHDILWHLQVFIVPFLDIKRFFATCCIISLLLLTSQELEDLSFPQLNSITNIGEQLRNILEQKHTITQGALQFSHLVHVMWEVIIITLVQSFTRCKTSEPWLLHIERSGARGYKVGNNKGLIPWQWPPDTAGESHPARDIGSVLPPSSSAFGAVQQPHQPRQTTAANYNVITGRNSDKKGDDLAQRLESGVHFHHVLGGKMSWALN